MDRPLGVNFSRTSWFTIPNGKDFGSFPMATQYKIVWIAGSKNMKNNPVQFLIIFVRFFDINASNIVILGKLKLNDEGFSISIPSKSSFWAFTSSTADC